jgi:hypothetical protein
MGSPSKKSLIAGVAALVILIVASLLFFWERDATRGLERFPATTYFERPANLQGNRYSIDAWIESQLVWREGVGRILEVRLAQENGRVAVFVPAELDRNLYVGQRYRMAVRVQDGGVIYVQNLIKH